MTDRELLERAAKAAGVDVIEWDGNLIHNTGNQYVIRVWNPLTDDGDALRLAAKLYLWEAVRLAHRDVSADVDIYAATRRAIVRAAAAIGEQA